MRLSCGFLACCALAFFASGCQPAPTGYGPPDGCQIDSGNCNQGLAGGAGVGSGGAGGSGSGGAGGSGGTADFNGTVHVITSPAFDDVAMKQLTSTATIVAAGPGGMNVTAMYPDPNMLPQFDIPNALQGARWVEVQDGTNGGAGILSTWSVVDITSPSVPQALPVIELTTLQNIASALPSVGPVGVSAQAAQVIIIASRNSQPVKGITVSGGGAGAQIAYDVGPGNYSDQTSATGTGGTIILFNAGINGTGNVILKDTSNPSDPGTGYTITAAQGAATIVRVEI